jgi:hypothetical protein
MAHATVISTLLAQRRQQTQAVAADHVHATGRQGFG